MALLQFRFVVLSLILFGAWRAVLPGDLPAAENGSPAVVAAHLAAGEFAPALAIARDLPSVERRDAILAQIATAQARSGAFGASLDTAAEIRRTSVRSEALAAVRGAPIIGDPGGATMADFDSVIQLITSTIQPETWEDVGGPGSVAPFATGVYIDPEGTLRRLTRDGDDRRLADLLSASSNISGNTDAARPSPLRKVSLPRLEKQLQLRAAAGKGPTETMEFLAGLRRIEYVFLYPESGDLVIAGPAGGWRLGEEGRVLGSETGQPVVRLDDLLVILRKMSTGDDLRFGCLIAPTQEGLARVKAFAEESSSRPLRRGERAEWLAQLREKLGKQNLEVYGIDARTRTASVMLEADYRMKLVGMGLEKGVPGVDSYLDLVRRNRDTAGAMSVLRWWFALNYDNLVATGDRTAFAIVGPGTKVLSENELLEADGRRIHTGQSDELNREFAASFTKNFEQLCHAYPVYAELRNICDLAIVFALVRRESLGDRIEWDMAYLRNEEALPVHLGPMPRQVDSVIAHRVLGRGEIVVGVSGGVRVDPEYLVSKSRIVADRSGRVSEQYRAIAPPAVSGDVWWWD